MEFRKLLISQRDAAAEQIDAAIDMLFAARWIPAITLAGAAESVMPDTRGDNYLFKLLKREGAERMGMTEKKFISRINEARDWLKHDQNSPLEISEFDALAMILRAVTKFSAVYGDSESTINMHKFEGWFRETHPDYLKN